MKCNTTSSRGLWRLFFRRLWVSAFIGLRYTRAKRRNQFISFVSGFSFVGMALGTLSLIVVMSVMNGFDAEIKHRLLKVVPHGLFEAEQPILEWKTLQQTLQTHEAVVATEPYVSGFGMVSYQRSLHGVALQGLLPDKALSATLEPNMLLGSLEQLQPGQYNVVMGRLLARALGVTTGDKINLTLPQLNVTPAGIFPRMKRFTLVGVFEVGAQVDQNLLLLHLTDAQKLLRLGAGVSGVSIQTTDMYKAAQVVDSLNKKLSRKVTPHLTQVTGKDWSQTQGSLFAAVKMEKTVVSLLLMVVIAVAAFNIISSLVLMVADKRTDIAVLRTLGFTRHQIMNVFVVQGFAIGATGVAIGALVGVAVASYIGGLVALWESLTGILLFDPNVYFISQLPADVQWSDVLLVMLVGLLLSFLSTLYPAYRASQVEPAEALRYE